MCQEYFKISKYRVRCCSLNERVITTTVILINRLSFLSIYTNSKSKRYFMEKIQINDFQLRCCMSGMLGRINISERQS